MINHASRNKVSDKIKTLGPYATALKFILHKANDNRDDKTIKGLDDAMTIYRGVQLSEDEL